MAPRTKPSDFTKPRRKPSAERPAASPATPPPRSGGGAVLAKTGLAALSGCLVFLSFPTFDHSYLLWFALVPLLVVLETASPRAAAWYGFVAGLATNLGGFYWIDTLLREFGHMPTYASVPITVVLAAYQGLVFLLWALWTVALRRRTRLGWFALAPAVFVAVELIVPFLFPWYLGNGQYRVPEVTQIAEITGVFGITWLVVLVNVGLFSLLRAALRRERPPLLRVAVVAALFGANYLYGVLRIGQIDAAVEAAPKLRIGMVEADIGIWEKEARELLPEERVPTLYRNLLRHQMMSRELERQGAELIVWPESSFIPIGDVWVKSTDLFALAVGRDGVMAQQRGRTWVGPDQRAAYPFPDERLRGLDLSAVWAPDEQRAFAVGAGGLVLAYEGGRWQQEETGDRERLLAVWGSPVLPPATPGAVAPLSVVAAGENGALLVRDPGGGWRRTPSPVAGTLRALAGRSPEEVYAVGDDGLALAFDGAAWRRLPDSGGDARAAAVAPDGSLWVVGAGGFAATFDGRAWTRTATGTERALHGVWAPRRDLVIAVGAAGSILRREGGRWRSEASGVSEDLFAVTADPRGGFVAVGAKGRVVHVSGGVVTATRAPTDRDLLGVAGLGYAPDFPIPHDVAYIRPSLVPLPEAPDADRGEPLDRETPSGERNTVHRGFSTPVLFGAVTYDLGPDGDDRLYNSVLLVGRDGEVLGRYDKVYLLLFGEYIPFEGYLSPETRKALHELLPEAGRFEAGETVTTFPFAGHQLGPMVCYEDILPRFAQKLAGKRPNVFVNVTNDAWFGRTSEPYLHLALATFRAIESRLALVRSTNTGVSAFVDPVGRLRQQTGLEAPEVLLEDVPMLDLETPYRRFGDVFAYGCFAFVGAMTVWGFRRRR